MTRRHLLALTAATLAGTALAADPTTLAQAVLTSGGAAIWGGLFALPAAWWAYRNGRHKNVNDAQTARELAANTAAAARDAADLAALVARDKAVSDLHLQLSSVTGRVMDLASENGRLANRCETLEKRSAERDTREREYVKEIETLKVQLKSLDTCAGGAPCPLLHRRIVTP